MEPITITIRLDTRTGKMQLEGPIQDTILCLGILEAAKHQVMRGVPKRPGIMVADNETAKALLNNGS